MIVHEPELERRDGQLRVSARVEFRDPRPSLPDRLWIETADGAGPAPGVRADGFAVALLHLAMAIGEDMEIRGEVCPRLLSGLAPYQERFAAWFPGRLRRVAVEPSRASPPPRRADGRVGQAFSGGVDSFFTLRERAPRLAAPGVEPVSRAVLVHGFDVPLTDDAGFRSLEAAYRPMLRELGVELVAARTNLRALTRPAVSWEISHGAALAFAALAFGGGFRAFLIPATQACDELLPWGSDPRVDPLLSTAATEIVHAGAERDRVEKLLAIADWEPARRGLRVCWERPRGLVNCCRCSKCLRTMAALTLAGALDRFPTFPLPYDRRRLRRLVYRDEVGTRAARNLLDAARRAGDRRLAADVEHSLRRSRRALAVRRWWRGLAGQAEGRRTRPAASGRVGPEPGVRRS